MPASLTHRTTTVAVAAALALAASAPVSLASDYIMRHGMTPQAYQNFYDDDLPASYRPIAIAAHGTDASARYTAVWADDEHNDWAARHGQTSAEHQADGTDLADQGYRVISLDASGDYPNERYASLWVNDGTSPSDWGAVHRQTKAQMETTLDDYESAGFRPVWITGSGDGSARRFAATFVRNDEQWTYRTFLDLSPEDYQEEVETHLRAGYRVLAMSGYGEGDVRFAVVFVRPDGPNWEKQSRWFAHHGQSGEQFQDVADAHYNVTKFEPACVAQYEHGFGSVYVERKAPAVFTATGVPQPGISHFDAVMESFMTSRKFQRGALAITKDGRLVYNRAFTYDDPGVWKTQPHHRFRVASVSKPITAVATLKAVEMGLFDLDTTLGEIDGFDDSGWGASNVIPNDVTIDMLLKHQGGWDRDLDPMLDDVAIADELSIPLPIVFDDIIDATKDQPLLFLPGMGYEYSNFGYGLLGHVIELTSGQSYESFTRQYVLCPIGAGTMRLGRTSAQDRHPDEVNYEDLMFRHYPSVMSDDRPYELRPYSRYNIDNMDAHGGWVATVEELARFVSDFTTMTGSTLLTFDEIDYMFNENEQTNSYGAGWGRSGSVRVHNGLLPGTWAWLIRMDNGVTLSAVFNGSSGGFDIPTADLDGEIYNDLVDAVNLIENAAGVGWPSGDLFGPGACSIVCPGDVTGDGIVGSADLARLVGSWGQRNPATDLDGDGIVGSSDLAVLIGAWGECR